MGLVAGIGAAVGIGGALIRSSSANKAANAQTQAAQMGIEEQRRQYDLTREDLAPWRTAGAATLTTLTGQLPELTARPTGFQQDPGYQFAFNEGRRAVEGSAASKGMLMGGGTLKDLTRFGTGMADQQYGNWWGREMALKDSTYNKLSGVAQMGQNAAAQTGSFGAQKANSIADLMTQQGNARASGAINSGKAWSDGLNDIYSIFKGGF